MRVSRTATWTLAELLSVRTSSICENASAIRMITYSTVADVPQSGDLDLVAGRQCGGIDDPQFPVDVGPRTQKRVVVSSARASPRLWTVAVNSATYATIPAPWSAERSLASRTLT
jgi:hypothetical protein